MPHATIFTVIAQSIALLFAAAGALQLAGPGFVRHAYERWGMPRNFHRVTGALELVTAAFLAMAETRIWGVGLAAIITFTAVVTLLKSEQYAWSVPAVLLLAALVPASLAMPL